MLQTRVVEKIKAHILFMFDNLFSENCVVREIMWKNTVKLDSPQMII